MTNSGSWIKCLILVFGIVGFGWVRVWFYGIGMQHITSFLWIALLVFLWFSSFQCRRTCLAVVRGFVGSLAVATTFSPAFVIAGWVGSPVPASWLMLYYAFDPPARSQEMYFLETAIKSFVVTWLITWILWVAVAKVRCKHNDEGGKT